MEKHSSLATISLFRQNFVSKGLCSEARNNRRFSAFPTAHPLPRGGTDLVPKLTQFKTFPFQRRSFRTSLSNLRTSAESGLAFCSARNSLSASSNRPARAYKSPSVRCEEA